MKIIYVFFLTVFTVVILIVGCKTKPKMDYAGKMKAINERAESQISKIHFEGEIRVRLLQLGIKGEAADKHIDSMNRELAMQYGNNPIPYLNPYISEDSATKLIDSIFGK